MERTEELAARFRSAMERAWERGRLKGPAFDRFPRGSCGDTCDLLGQYLLDNGVRTRYVCGTFGRSLDFDAKQSHAWLVDEAGNVVDITADQFEGQTVYGTVPPSAYYGPPGEFYSQFEIDHTYSVQPLECFPEEVALRLQGNYCEVLACLS